MKSVLIFMLLMFNILSCSETGDDIEFCNLGEYTICTYGPTKGSCALGRSYCNELYQESCKKDCITTYWGECLGEILPVDEVCNGIDDDCDGSIDEGVVNRCGLCGLEPPEVCNGRDDNCNGQIDEGFSNNKEICNGIDDNCDGRIDETLEKRSPCIPEGASESIIYKSPDNQSTCEMGWKECREGYWSSCREWVGPHIEVCNNLDDNCNGKIDDLFSINQLCGVSDIGECKYGFNVCASDELICAGEVYPIKEVCNRLDDDCDGLIDNDIIDVCETDCGPGFKVCSMGEFSPCSSPLPTLETCNGLDDDCDGVVDEGLECYCIEGQTQLCRLGSCGYGVQYCYNNKWSDCAGGILLNEACNGYDDNCNGIVDESLEPLSCYTGPEETNGIGLCVSGLSYCRNGNYSECLGEFIPTEESCNGLDDNCDGNVDNKENLYENMDVIFAIDISSSMSYVRDAIVEAVRDYIISLSGNNHRFGIVTFGGQIEPPVLSLNLTDSSTELIMSLESITTVGSVELSLDTIYLIANPFTSRTLDISWRSSATPIVLMFSDEGPQTSSDWNLTADDIRLSVQVCRLVGCYSSTNYSWIDGDPLELYIFTTERYRTYWSTIISPFRLKALSSLDADLLKSEIINVFEEICLTQ